MNLIFKMNSQFFLLLNLFMIMQLLQSSKERNLSNFSCVVCNETVDESKRGTPQKTCCLTFRRKRNYKKYAPEELKPVKFTDHDEINMIQKYLRAYSNPSLATNVANCVEDVFMQFQNRTSAKIDNWYKKLAINAKSPGEDIIKTIFHDLYLGSGSYAFVLKNSHYKFDEEVMKISLGKRTEYDPMWKSEMPWEYCVGLLSPTSHILKPIENSFQPIELPPILFNSYVFISEKKKIEFFEPVAHGWTKSSTVVPMFEMPMCQDIVWTNLPDFNTSAQFVELLHALNDIHKSGIALNDISQFNIMSCNSGWKFIDLGFATLYDLTKEYQTEVDTFIFGNENHRSPWADIVSQVSINSAKKFTNWNLKEIFVLELIANDYWSLALLFGEKFCDLFQMKHFKNFKNLIKSIIDNIGLKEEKDVINHGLQFKLDSIFSILKDKKKSSCSPFFQELLLSILQVNPVNRMRNVEKILLDNHQMNLKNF